MRNLIVFSLFVFLTSSMPVLGQQTYEEDLLAAVQQYVVAFNAGDVEAAAALYTPDGFHTYAGGFTHHGRDEIARGLRDLLSGPLKGARLSITSLNVRFLAPTIAVEEESFTLDGLRSPDGQALPIGRGFCLSVYEQLEGKWLAEAVQCMVPFAAAGPDPQ